MRRLAQELHHHVEGFERMVDDDVLLAYGRETIAAEIADSLGKTRVVRREQEIGAFVDDQLFEVGLADQPVDGEDIRGGDLQLIADDLHLIVWHLGRDRQADAGCGGDA